MEISRGFCIIELLKNAYLAIRVKRSTREKKEQSPSSLPLTEAKSFLLINVSLIFHLAKWSTLPPHYFLLICTPSLHIKILIFTVMWRKKNKKTSVTWLSCLPNIQRYSKVWGEVGEYNENRKPCQLFPKCII